ncbi:hypothetical protein HN873_010875 [Arachis hypogaea]
MLDQQHNKRSLTSINLVLVPMETLPSDKPRVFIDAWSNTVMDREINDANNKNSISPIGKLSLSSLDLSIESGYMHEEVGLGRTRREQHKGIGSESRGMGGGNGSRVVGGDRTDHNRGSGSKAVAREDGRFA